MKNRIFIVLAVIINCSTSIAQTPALWGTTPVGGTNSAGNIFKIHSTGVIANEYSFGNDTDGQIPCSALIQATNGLVYGITRSGGAFGNGTIFSYNTSTGTEVDLHDFGRGVNDGKIGYGSFIQDTNGLLYGMTYDGGNYDTVKSSGGGIIFSFNTLTNTETKLHDFGISGDGAHPHGSLLQDTNGLLYGMTYNGGVNDTGAVSNGDGTIFSFNIATGVETVLHNFGGANDGKNPYGSLIQVGNTLYGMAGYGSDYSATGILFSYNTSNGVYTVLHNFGSDTDGALPAGSLLLVNDSLLYGMTTMGGAIGEGIIFSYNISSGKETILHSFGSGNDGYTPDGSFMRASNGLLYATTNLGGANNAGTVFSYDISNNVYTTVSSFSGGADGLWPLSDLIEVDSSSTGIGQLSANNNQLSVYPNPTSDFIHVTVQLNQPSYLQLRLVNMLGQTMYVTDAGTVSSYQNNISIADLADGVYLLEMVTGGGMETREVVVAR